MAFLNESGLARLWQNILAKLNTKVDKEEGKGLSTNDFTTAEKEKLASLENSSGGLDEEALNDFVFITTDDIDTICGTTIEVAEEVTF